MTDLFNGFLYTILPFVKKTTRVRLRKENLICPNYSSKTYILNSWQHRNFLLVANQFQASTFLFEINSGDIGISQLILQLQLLPSS